MTTRHSGIARFVFVASLAATGCGFGAAGGEAPAGQPASAAAPVGRADAPAAAGAGGQRWKRVGLGDRQLFGRDTTFVSLLIPADWHWQGAVDIAPREFAGCPENALSPHGEAASADGRLAVALLPALTTVHFRLPALKVDVDRRRQMGQTFCRESPRLTLPDFVESLLIPAWRPGARVTGYRVEPQLTASLRGELRALPSGPDLQTEAEVGVVTIRYQVQGEEVDEAISLQGVWQTQEVVCTAQQRAQEALVQQMHTQYGMTAPVYCGDGRGSQINSTYTPLVAVRTPAGRVEEFRPLLTDIIASMQVDARATMAVLTAIGQMRRAIFNSAIGEIRDTSRIWREAWDRAGQSGAGSGGRDADGRLDVAGLWSDTILETEDFRDRNGETVRLSSHYNHVYSNGQGEYILSNDPSSHPAVELGQDWQAITPIGRR